MKQKLQITRGALACLVTALAFSLLLNVVLYAKSTRAAPILQGTYSQGGLWLACDPVGHFCLYTQDEGLLEEGNYMQSIPTQSPEKQYTLTGVSGWRSGLLLTEAGVYVQTEQGNLVFLPQIDATPIFAGNWAQDWPHWPDGPYPIP